MKNNCSVNSTIPTLPQQSSFVAFSTKLPHSMKGAEPHINSNSSNCRKLTIAHKMNILQCFISYPKDNCSDF